MIFLLFTCFALMDFPKIMPNMHNNIIKLNKNIIFFLTFFILKYFFSNPIYFAYLQINICWPALPFCQQDQIWLHDCKNYIAIYQSMTSNSDKKLFNSNILKACICKSKKQRWHNLKHMYISVKSSVWCQHILQ